MSSEPSALFYEANAGTGKTWTLTEFVLQAVQTGMSLERICALTFTDKAANEMLSRLREGVAKLVELKALEPWQMQMSSRCFIGTIHSFCLQLVKRYAPQLSLPPLFEIDPQEEKFEALFENRWDEYLSKILSDPTEIDRALVTSLGVRTLRELAEVLVRTRYDFHREDDDLQWLAEDLSLQKEWGFKNGSWGAFTAALVKDYERYRSVLSAMIHSRKFTQNKGEYHQRLKNLLACKNEELHRAIVLIKEKFAKPFLLEYHASGYVLYEDLLMFARRLLTDRTIRKEMKERYDLLLVDEMQDTDAIQYEIILYLAEKKEAHQNYTLREVFEGSHKFEIQPGKLFVVGDPKQSIYGFRNADLSAYECMKTVLTNTGAEIRPLDQNYRSCANLVEFSNLLASSLFPQMKPHDSNAVKSDLCKDQSLDHCVHLVRIQSPDSDRVHLRILSEANWIARKIRNLVGTEKKAYKDVAVLLRKLVHSHLYVDALTAQGIPVIIEGERFFYRSQEVIDFINLIKFIVDDKDELALAGMLRSPLFAMTDIEIARFFHSYQQNGKIIVEALSSTLTADTSRERLLLFDRIFEIRKQIHLLNPASLIDLVLQKLPVLSVAGMAYGSSRNTLAPLNILRIQKYAMELQNDPAHNLFHFVSVLSQFSREGKERGQEPLADEGLDAVRMMSIHNSKGLDFPVVFVPLTDYDIRHSGSAYTEVAHNWATGSAGLKVNGVTESNYLRLKYGTLSIVSRQEDRFDMDDEEKRVLYVAATRAREQVYFCCLEDAGGKKIMALLHDLSPLLLPFIDEESSALLETPSVTGELGYQSLQTIIDQWQKLESVGLQRSGVFIDSVTGQAEKLEPGEVEETQLAVLLKKAGGTLVGLLCHGALERWNYENPHDLDEILMIEQGKYFRQFSKKIIDDAVAISRELLSQFASSEAAKWVSSTEIVGRELPVLYFDRQSRKILSGKIDLLVKENDHHCIVDYKTDAVLPEAMRKRYAEQMRLYASALSSSVQGPLYKKLLMIRTGEIVDL